MKPDVIIVHYAEIGLKGRNRPFFEKTLVNNIKKSLKGTNYEMIKRIYGRIIITLKPDSDIRKIKTCLKKIFGISSFSLGYLCEKNLSDMKKLSWDIARIRKFRTFKIDCKRSDKSYPLTSMEVNKKVGAYLLNKARKKVSLEKPDMTIFIEITEKNALLYTGKISGPGGLPVGASGKIICMLSSGIDSPLAAYYSMKRGCNVVFVHFHSYPYTNRASIDKSSELANILKDYQNISKIYHVPFVEIQKKIVASTNPSSRMILYRRMMLRIAEKIAEKEGAKAIVTGESIGQVASQTLDNISVIGNAASMPVLRPLIGIDKQDIIKQAIKIGTYDISIRPHSDCCTLFMPSNPETRASEEKIRNMEKSLKIGKMVKDALKNTEIHG